MAYIFMDESGDLGFNWSKKKTSKYFIITVLFVPHVRKVQKIVSKVHSTLRKSHKAKSGVLHAYKESPTTRHRMLRLLSEDNITVMTICLNKKKVYTQLQNEQNVLYNYVVNILLDRINTRKLIPTDEKIILIASRKDTNKFLNNNFTDYLEGVKSGHGLDLSVEIKTPHAEKCLQAADFLSWSIFRKYEHNDMSYYNMIKDIIVEEFWLYGD